MAEIQVPMFRARPTGETRTGIVVIHEGSGMTLQVLRFCERLAGEGYVVAAPDLYFRTGGPAARTEYMEQMGPVYEHRSQTFDDLATAAAALRAEGAERIGVTGFCMGGSLSWQVAVDGEGFDAAVCYYGAYIASQLGTPRCPTLVLLAGDDPFVPTEDAEKIAAFHPDTVIYPGVGHGFMRDLTEHHAPDAAADAWARMLAHFEANLA